MNKLDRTEQRLVGVLIEKQFTVPDTYPLSENALVDGCNQKNNRDPVTELVAFQVAGALMSLQEKGVVARVDGGGRVPKFRHKLDEVLQVGKDELAVLAELLLRGPQAPGALKPRVQRMGYHAAPEQIEALLRQLHGRLPPLVELLPLAPRERDRRWRHLLGDGSERAAEGGGEAAVGSAVAGVPVAARVEGGDASHTGLVSRIEALEAEVRRLAAELASLRRG
ncbi:MAG: DUF480 domain-containing protein [Planctomycetota bacterium]